MLTKADNSATCILLLPTLLAASQHNFLRGHYFCFPCIMMMALWPPLPRFSGDYPRQCCCYSSVLLLVATLGGAAAFSWHVPLIPLSASATAPRVPVSSATPGRRISYPTKVTKFVQQSRDRLVSLSVCVAE